jgi:hypothetical protein
VNSTLSIAVLLFSMMGFAQNPGTPSQEELIKRVLSGIEAKDEKALEHLTISKDEFKKYVWPVIASRVSGSNTTAENFYDIYARSSGVGVTQNLTDLGGKKFEIVKVSPGPIQKQTKDYRLFLAPEVVVRDSTGQERTVRPVGGLLEQGGSFKVTTYYLGAQGTGK